MLQDIRYAVRQLLKAPAFTLTAVLTLALGIGANAAIFSIVNALFLRPLPVERPEEIVRLFTSEWSEHGVSDRRFGTSSYPNYLDFRDGAKHVLGELASYTVASVVESGADGSAPLNGTMVSGNYFTMLGLRPALGRFFAAEEDGAPMAHPVIVLAHDYWRTRFAGDSAVLGRRMVLNGTPFTVIGVAPEKFAGADAERTGDFFVPMATQRAIYPGGDMLSERGSRWLDMMGRLQPGVTPERAETVLNALMRRLGEAHPRTDANRVITVRPSSTLLGADDRGAAMGVSAGMLVVTGVVLVIAALNVAGLLLVRAVQRRREFAVRLALGAGRWRLVRQLVTESVLLSLLAAGPAVLLALWATDLARTLDLPIRVDLAPDWRVVSFTLAVAMATGIVFGLAPALRASRPSVLPALKDGAGGSGERGGTRLRDALVMGQLALSLLLLAVGGLLVRSLREQQRADVGFAIDRLLVVPMRLELLGYEGAASTAVRARMLERVRALPGVEAAALTGTVPMGGGRSRSFATIPGYTPAPREDMEIFMSNVSADWFRTVGVPLVRGREMTSADAGAAPVALVNEAAARRYWSGREAVGAALTINGRTLTVAAVTRDFKLYAASEPAVPTIFIQHPIAGHALQVRAARGTTPTALVAAVRAALLEVEPRLVLDRAEPMTATLRASLLPARAGASAVGAFGALSLLLAALGLYGVMSYAVAQRSREIGVRIALGAARGNVVRLVVGQALRLVLVGGLIGTALAIAAARVLGSALYGVGAADPVTFAVVALLLGATALLASALPARRAARLDPVVALRAE